jgi:hypothetical protein
MAQPEQPSLFSRINQILNTVLVANTFFVLFSFIWFAAALVGRGAGVPLGLDVWHSLWDPVFTPAIGLLMGGALLSGAIGYVAKRLPKREG